MSATFLCITVALAILAAVLIGVPLWRFAQAGSAGKWLGTGLAVVLLPLAVLALYVRVTTYPWDDPQLLTAPAPGSPQEIETMVSDLAAGMATEPTLEGLAMLGRSYMALQRYEEAVEVYHKAWEMTEGRDPNVALVYAEALILTDRDTIRTSAADLLDGVLLSLPDNPRALWYGGLSSLARGRTDEGRARWVQLLGLPDLPEQLRNVVQQQLAALDGTAADASGTATEAPAPQATAAGGPELAVTVSLSAAMQEKLGGQLPAAARLFVFVRRGAGGPPLAVTRVRPGGFPQAVKLSNRDVMIEGNSLAAPGTLALTARLALNGEASASPGDLYGETQLQWNGSGANATVLIDQIVPE